MNSEPPVGDDLQRMLVSMKQNVLERATPRPKRRSRHVGIAIGVVGVLLLGAAGGGVALGLIPTLITAAPVPSASSTPEPSVSETPTGAPVTGRPTPRPTPSTTPTPTRPAYALDDPSTWTISGDEVGPIAIGGDFDAETDDLAGVFTRDDPDCAAPEESVWDNDSGVGLAILEQQGRIMAVQVSGAPGLDRARLPRTPADVGVGSTVDEVRAAYPDAFYESIAGTRGNGPTGAEPFGGWRTTINGVHVFFSVWTESPEEVYAVTASTADVPPYFLGACE